MRLSSRCLFWSSLLHAACASSDRETASDATVDTEIPPPDTRDSAMTTDGDAGCRDETTAALRRSCANPLALGWSSVADGKHAWTMADPSVMYDEDEKLWKAWWSSVVVETCGDAVDDTKREIDVFYAESVDGRTWNAQTEPVLRSHRGPTTWDDDTVETPTVVKMDDAPAERRYAMIYAGANGKSLTVLGQLAWQLGLAFSADGKSFARLDTASSPYAGKSTPFGDIGGLVFLARDALPAYPDLATGILADPELVRVGSTFHLWFSAVGVNASGSVVGTGDRVAFGIGHATSNDLIHWTPQSDNPVIVGGGQPTVDVSPAGEFDLWYGSDTDAEKKAIPSAVFPTRGFFHAQSTDGLAWTKQAERAFNWDSSVDYESLGLINGADVVRFDDEFRLYYGAWGTRGVPPGSCAYIKDGTGAVTTTSGVFSLNMAVRK